ncbi:MAG TPA: hypothetical protein VF092_20555, partial [Longimicrobium sp.]
MSEELLRFLRRRRGSWPMDVILSSTLSYSRGVGKKISQAMPDGDWNSGAVGGLRGIGKIRCRPEVT